MENIPTPEKDFNRVKGFLSLQSEGLKNEAKMKGCENSGMKRFLTIEGSDLLIRACDIKKE